MEIEVELNEAEPTFLKGHTTKSGLVLSPVKVSPFYALQPTDSTTRCPLLS